MIDALVATVSGGRFPSQLCALRLLSEHNYRPPLVFAGSGGAIAAYCAMAGDWTLSGIERVASSLNSDIFTCEQSDNACKILPNAAAAYFVGYIKEYNREAPKKFLENYFTPKTVRDTEVWIGAVNARTERAALFCNRSMVDCILHPDEFDLTMFNCEPLHYLDGDLNHIAQAICASASVPMLVEPVSIGADRYVDCGVCFASALIPLQNVLSGASKQGLHIVHLPGVDVELIGARKRDLNMLARGTTTSEVMIRSLIAHDRATAYQLISKFSSGRPNYCEFPISDLGAILSNRMSAAASVVEIYPQKTEEIDIFDFRGEDVLACMNEALSSLAIRVWWVGDPKLFR